MVIFNSYVKLPEGKQNLPKLKLTGPLADNSPEEHRVHQVHREG